MFVYTTTADKVCEITSRRMNMRKISAASSISSTFSRSQLPFEGMNEVGTQALGLSNREGRRKTTV